MLSACNINITDSCAALQLKEIIDELTFALGSFNTHSMNEHQLFLQGKYEALKEVILYLKRVQ